MTKTEPDAGARSRSEAALAADLAALERLTDDMSDPHRTPDTELDLDADRGQIPSDPPAPPPPLQDPIPPMPVPPAPLPDPPPAPTAFAAEIAELEHLIAAIEVARTTAVAAGDIPMPPGTPPGDLPPQPVPIPTPDPVPGPMPPGPMPDPGPDQTPGPQMDAPRLEETLAADMAAIAAEVAALKLRLADLAHAAAPQAKAAPKADPARDIAAITGWVESLAQQWPAHLEPPKPLRTLVFAAGIVRGMLPPEAMAGAAAERPSVAPQAEGVGPGATPAVSPTAAAAGRAADHPAAIPAAGWRQVAARVWDQVWEDRVPAVAAGVAFYALLALFPAITALVSIFGLFADRAIVLSNLAQLDHLIPAPALELIRIQIDALLATDPATLTFATALSLALALWTANGGMKAMIEALNVAYGERERRNLVVLNLWSLAMTFGGLAMVIVILGLSTVLPPLLARLPTELGTDRWMLALRWPVMLALLLAVLALLYRFGPSRHGAKWRWVGPGTLIAAVLLIVASMGFSTYTANFASYNETYGSLGAVVALMVWVWISAMVVLLGAEINSEAERQTARDTTTGRPRAMGQRGAFAADTLGD